MPVATDDMLIYRGEKKVWQFTLRDISNTVVNLTGVTTGLYFTVRYSIPTAGQTADNDTSALFALTQSNGISAISAGVSGIFEITVDKGLTTGLNPTAALNSPLKFYYGLEYVPTGETSPRVLAQGNFYVYPSIVMAV